MAKLGAHVSIVGGFTKALEKLHSMGGNCMQVFSSSPRTWSSPVISDEQIHDFLKIKSSFRISPVYFHAPYLVNLASSGITAKQSKQALIAEFQLAEKMEIKGSIMHLGSFGQSNGEAESTGSYDLLIQNIRDILAATPETTLFIIENSATKKIGMTLDEISKIIQDVNDKRVRVCFDTCHLHAAGYNLSTAELLDQFLETFNKFIGLELLEAWHLNDSKDPFGSRRDRHENIGKGNVGTEVFRLLLNHPQTKHFPFIIETPGFDDKGPDKENLDILKSMLEIPGKQHAATPALP